MLNIQQFFGHDQRIRISRPGSCADGHCVLYWMQNAQRGRDNTALNAAIALGNILGLPVLVLFILAPYPSANLRHYTFLLEGLAETARHLNQRGTPLLMRVGDPVQEVPRALREVQAAALISDEAATRVPRTWREEICARIGVPFACVDADVMIPTVHFQQEEWAARTLRPKVQRLLPTYSQPLVDLEVLHPLAKTPCDPGYAAQPLAALDRLSIDRSVPPSPLFQGGQSQAERLLRRFLDERLAHYSEERNHPEHAGTSELSAYLHFGQIAIQRIVWETVHGELAGQEQRESLYKGRDAFLEEVIVRRELAINFVLRNPHYDTFEGCPAWGKTTLEKHRTDPREWIYTLAELEKARTHDELWNASQREMVATGRMHGYMRMYWAKKILEWSADPREAFDSTVYLNDRYELDGRDASSYTNISWAIGGRHDRPWGPERPIYGLVRSMSLAGMQRKIDTAAYIQRWSTTVPE